MTRRLRWGALIEAQINFSVCWVYTFFCKCQGYSSLYTPLATTELKSYKKISIKSTLIFCIVLKHLFQILFSRIVWVFWCITTRSMPLMPFWLFSWFVSVHYFYSITEEAWDQSNNLLPNDLRFQSFVFL